SPASSTLSSSRLEPEAGRKNGSTAPGFADPPAIQAAASRALSKSASPIARSTSKSPISRRIRPTARPMPPAPATTILCLASMVARRSSGTGDLGFANWALGPAAFGRSEGGGGSEAVRPARSRRIVASAPDTVNEPRPDTNPDLRREPGPEPPSVAGEPQGFDAANP